MDAGEDREYSRQPRPEDLTRICASLNREGARYLLIGGFAVITHGLETHVIRRGADQVIVGLSWLSLATNASALNHASSYCSSCR